MTEPRTWVKIPLFLSSYFPLWLIFFVTLILHDKYQLFSRKIEENQSVVLAAIVLLLIMIVSFVIVGLLVRQTVKGNNPSRIVVKERQDFTGEYMLYVVTYVIPFLADDFLEPSRLAALAILMATIGTLYIRASLYHVNPTLNLLGYKLYQISDSDDNKYLLLSKQGDIHARTSIMANPITQSIYVESSRTKTDTSTI